MQPDTSCGWGPSGTGLRIAIAISFAFALTGRRTFAGDSYFLVQKCCFGEAVDGVGQTRTRRGCRRGLTESEGRTGGSLRWRGFLRGFPGASFQGAVDIDDIVGDHAEADPSLHSSRSLVVATVEAMASFGDADAAFAAG